MRSLPTSSPEVQQVNVTTESVEFYGDRLQATKINGEVWVGLRRCCESIGVRVQSQLPKLQAKSWASIMEIMTLVEGSNLPRITTMIDLDTLCGWLFSIDERKVLPEVREKLIRYQREASKVLRRHFFEQPAAKSGPCCGCAILKKRLAAIHDALQIGCDEFAEEIGVRYEAVAEEPLKEPERVRIADYCESREIISTETERLRWATKMRKFCRLRGRRLEAAKKGTPQTYPVDLLDAFFAER